MGNMSVNQLAWRRRQVMDNIMQVPHHYHNPEHLHRRGYDKGDMSCTHCKKWLNPDKPEEAKEIKIAKNGLRMHIRKYCPVYSPYTATLVMFAKFRPSRSKRVAEAKRY